MPVDFEKLKARRARRSTTGWTPKEGDNLIRILPHTSKWFEGTVDDIALEFRSHFLKAEGVDTQVVRCLRDAHKTCPFCVLVAKHRDDADISKKKMAEQIRAGERHLFNIIDLNDVAAGVQLYECGPQVFDGVLDYASNPAWGEIVSPAAGRHITLHLTPGSKSRSGFNSYSAQPHPQVVDITPHLPADWKDKIDEIPSGIPPYPDDETIDRWLKALGAAPVMNIGPLPSGVAISSASPPTAAAPPPTAAAPPPTAIPSAVATSVPEPIAAFCAANGLVAVEKRGKAVPQCFADGPGTGFNPQKHPCEKGCPKRADCQLISLGLVT